MSEIVDIPAIGPYTNFSGYGFCDGAGTAVPPDGALGWAYGAIFHHVDGSGVTGAIYINIGDKSSANFDGLFDIITLANLGLYATAAEINRACDVSLRLVTLSGATNITVATHEGKTCLLTGTGSAYTQTLPAPTGSGAKFLFIVGAVNTSNHVIYTGNASIAFVGNIITNSIGDTPDLAQPWPSTAASTITLNGTTQGGAQVGDWIECIDIAADAYAVRGVTTTSGVETTPFS